MRNINKDSLITKRVEYVAQRLSVVENNHTEIRRIANDLFLTERTIYNDFKKAKEMNLLNNCNGFTDNAF